MLKSEHGNYNDQQQPRESRTRSREGNANSAGTTSRSWSRTNRSMRKLTKKCWKRQHRRSYWSRTRFGWPLVKLSATGSTSIITGSLQQWLHLAPILSIYGMLENWLKFRAKFESIVHEESSTLKLQHLEKVLCVDCGWLTANKLREKLAAHMAAIDEPVAEHPCDLIITSNLQVCA